MDDAAFVADTVLDVIHNYKHRGVQLLKKNAIAIIPARGGSKRIPKKNIKEFLGKPLIAYSIEVALESKLFDKVVVTTDDDEIAQIAKEYGAEVPFSRPKEISDDYASSGDAVAHAIEFFKKKGEFFDFICTIYATAPLLQTEYLIEGFEKLKTSNAAMSFSVASMPFPIQRSFKITPEGRCKMFTPGHFYDRSQDLEEAYQDAGQFYWQNLNITLSDLPFGAESIPIILPRHLVQDIDTLEDWERAEKLYELLYPDSFDKWNRVKKLLNTKKQTLGFREKDILFVSVGKNIGYETLGKGDEYLRAVLVVKKFGKYSFFGVPLSTKTKEGDFYFNFSYKTSIVSTALLSQAKVFDAKRAKYRSGQIRQRDFEMLVDKLMGVITPFSKEKGSD
jgi:pseudaminic acid cytidylyltransferase